MAFIKNKKYKRLVPVKIKCNFQCNYKILQRTQSSTIDLKDQIGVDPHRSIRNLIYQ